MQSTRSAPHTVLNTDYEYCPLEEATVALKIFRMFTSLISEFYG